MNSSFQNISLGNAARTTSGASPAVIAEAMAKGGASGEEIAAVLARLSPPPEPMEHRDAWFQCFEGTSPCSMYTSMQAETRQLATPRSSKVEVYDTVTQHRLNLRLTVWPPTDPSKIPAHRVRALGEWWRKGLQEANVHLRAITPQSDQGVMPIVPVDADGLLERIYDCLDHYPLERVLRAWEASHHYVVNQYVTKVGAPSWAYVWQLPVFQTALGAPLERAAGASTSGPGGGALSLSKYCINWNTRTNSKCNPTPSDSCTKRHRCMGCDGDHPFASCSRRE